MNNKHRLSLFAYALLLAYPALGANQFTPFPPTPLNLQPKPADRVPPNVLFFIDNSYDSCRGAKTNAACNTVTGKPILSEEPSKLMVTKQVVKELTALPKYATYRFGAAAYQRGGNVGYFKGTQCGIQSFINGDQLLTLSELYNHSTTAGYHNWRITPCWPETYSLKVAIHSQPAEQAGAIIYAPITADKGDFERNVDKIADYKLENNDFGYSPLSSAYLELTRYYRGLSSGTDKERFKNLGDSAKAWDSTGTEYRSPIEYRCQSNNIVFISSAEDIRTADSRKDVVPFYKAFHEDPLYWHDNPDYSVDAKGMWFKAKNDDRPLGQPHQEKYNDNFKKNVLSIYLGSPYLLDKVDNLVTGKPVRYNPYLDHTEIVKAGKIQNANDYSKTTEDKKVIDFVQYHEKRSIEGFAHLAFEGDILKGKDGKKKVNGSETDKEGMRWDGTSEGDSAHNAKQNIRTFTVNFQLGTKDFENINVKNFGVTDGDKWDRLIIRINNKPKYKLAIGDCVYFNGQPIIENGKPLIVTGPLQFPNINPQFNVNRYAPSYIVGQDIQIVPKHQTKGDTCQLRGPEDTMASKLLKAAGEKGGGGFTSVSGGAGGLKDTLEHILDQIAASVISLPVGSALGSNDAKISTAITPTLNTDRWLSQLRFYNLRPDGIFKKDDFKEPDYTQPSTTLISTPDGLQELSVANTSFNNEAFNIGNPADLPSVNHNGKTGLMVALSSEQDEWERLVQWLLQTTEKDSDLTSKVLGVLDKAIYRDRAPKQEKRGHVLGDILDSNIVTFGGEESPVTGKSGKEKYKTGDNHPYLAVGANDGMLHIFQSNEKDAQAEHPYFHKFAYIPGTAKRTSENDTIMRNLVYTAEQNYGTQSNPHQYFVNGEIFYRKTDSGLVGQSDQGQMMLVGSLGQGGRAAYSLNIDGERYGSNDKVGLGTDKILLWDTSTDQFGKAKAGVDENMGYPIGSPQVGRVSLKDITKETQFNDKADVRYATFLNSGVDSGKNPTLFVLDQLGVNVAPKEYGKVVQEQKNAGVLIQAIKAGSEKEPGGLAAPLFVDYNRDGITDFVYAGDSNGNMWRFELRGGTANWKAIQIYKGSPTQPITTAPDIYYDGKGSKIHVFFGTGSVLYQKDFTDKNEQAMFGIVDDFSCSSDCSVSKEKLTKRELKEQTLQAKEGKVVVGSQEVSNTYREVAVLPEGSKLSGNGWYAPLNTDKNADNGSERVVVRPLVIADQYQNSGTVFFTTRIFQDIHATNGDVSCTPPPVKVKSWVMGLDVQTGSNPRKVRLGTIASTKASIAGYLVNGQASAFLRTDSGAEINQHGAGTQGIATPLSNPNQSVVRMVRACKVDGTANTAISVQNPDGSSTITRFELDCGKPLSRRLSWREIF